MPPGPQVGSAHIPITADGTQARQELDKTKGKLDQFGESIEKRTQGVRKFSGALGSTAGVLTGLVGVIATVVLAAKGLESVWASLTSGTRDLRAETEKLNERFDATALAASLAGDRALGLGFVQAAEDIERLTKELEEFQAQRAKAEGQNRFVFTDPGAQTASRQEARLKSELQTARNLLAGFVEEERKAAKAIADAKIVEDARVEDARKRLAQDRENQALFLATLGERDRIEAEARFERERSLEELADAETEGLRSRIRLEMGLRETLKKQRLADLDEIARKESEAADEKARKEDERRDEKTRKDREAVQKSLDDRLKAEQEFSAASAALARRSADSSIEQIGVTMETLPALIQQAGQTRRYSA